MTSRPGFVALGLAASSAFVSAGPLAASVSSKGGPCDIYAAGGTPCIAAHGTTRALYSAYSGPLYQVTRGSDGATADIAPLKAGGVANAASQDTFCQGTTCVISVIYDQSGRGNHLTQAPPGGATAGPETNGFDNLASAVGAPVKLGGKKAYGVFVSPGVGYRNNAVSGSATGDDPQGIYAVLDGTHYNDQCCFDYGNAEVNSHDTGNGHMEAIYFGDSTIWGSGSGSGPWIMADLENGLFSGANPKNNPADQSISHRFTTAIVKGTHNLWAIKGANAQSGKLSIFYNGTRPNASGYNPMSKEGAIILGIGGDNSDWAQGTFYEGVMTTGYPSDDVENAVQQNIVQAKYDTTPLTSGPDVKVGSKITIQITTPGYTNRFLAHNGTNVDTQVISSSSTKATQQTGTWIVRTGLGNSDCVSLESQDTAGSFIRHLNFQLYLQPNDGTKQFGEDATFCPEAGLAGQGNSFRAWGYPTRFFRHFNDIGYIASNGGPHVFDATYSFNNDVTFLVAKNFGS